MAGYQELIKNFDKLRDYMRDFFVYGYRTRNDFTQKSSRTYDNERRRVENYLEEHIKWDYGKNGKRVFVSVDAAKITRNPFYQAYLCRSFTDNDITLHFFILDILSDRSAMKVEEITDLIAEKYGETFDVQTVRAKLSEYARQGIVVATKTGRAFDYSLCQDNFDNTLKPIKNVQLMLDFFSGAAPFGIVGHYLQNRCDEEEEQFIFKHRFIAHTLDDNILLTILKGMKERREIKFTNFAAKSGKLSEQIGLPLKILASAQTGRRYIVMALLEKKRLGVFRLDHMKSVKLGEVSEDFLHWQNKAEKKLAFSWGSTIKQSSNDDDFEMVLYIDEYKELYVLHRLEREKRHGSIEKVGDNHFRYSIKVSNAGELMAWVKSFTGRIVSVKSTNQSVNLFYNDMKRMEKMYGGD